MRFPLLVVLAIASPLVQSAPTCSNITISVTTQPTTAKVPLLPLPLDPTAFLGNINALVDSILTKLVSGTFNIAVTYCEPEVNIPSRANTIQVLLHGATYTKNYWFGLYKGDQYSWVAAASKNGYPTIAIDRLGNGESAHPDPVLDVQYPMQAQVVHQIIQMARAGHGPFPRAFSKIILVGHSVGSVVANAVNFLYPTDVDATILTGYSAYVAGAIPGAFVNTLPLPASLQDSRYRSLNPLYLEISSKSGMSYVFYGPTGTFDQSLQDFDFETRGTLSVGEAATILFSGNTAHGYTAPIYFMTGEEDQIFCNLIALPSFNIIPGCTTNNIINYLQQSQGLYPDTTSFGYYAIPNAGHCWQLHYAAQAAFNNGHQWLEDEGF